MRSAAPLAPFVSKPLVAVSGRVYAALVSIRSQQTRDCSRDSHSRRSHRARVVRLHRARRRIGRIGVVRAPRRTHRLSRHQRSSAVHGATERMDGTRQADDVGVLGVELDGNREPERRARDRREDLSRFQQVLHRLDALLVATRGAIVQGAAQQLRRARAAVRKLELRVRPLPERRHLRPAGDRGDGLEPVAPDQRAGRATPRDGRRRRVRRVPLRSLHPTPAHAPDRCPVP